MYTAIVIDKNSETELIQVGKSNIYCLYVFIKIKTKKLQTNAFYSLFRPTTCLSYA